MPQTGQSSASRSGSRTASARRSSAAMFVARVGVGLPRRPCGRARRRAAPGTPRGSPRRSAARGPRAGAAARCRRCRSGASRRSSASASRSGLRAPSAAATSAARSSSGSSAATSASSRRVDLLALRCRRSSRVSPSCFASSSTSREAEHRRERVVERGERVEHRRQLGVGEERAERGQRRGSQPCSASTAAAPARPARVVVGDAVGPLLRERDGSPASLRARAPPASRVGPVVVQALPRLRPRLRALLPALQRAGHQQLEPLRERRLAAAVAADDDGQAGARLELQRRGRADPAEALDGDRAQPHRRRGGAARGRRAGVAPRPRSRASPRSSRSLALSRSSSRVRRTGSIRTGSRSAARWRRSSCRTSRTARRRRRWCGRARARTATAASAAPRRTRSPPPRCRAAGRAPLSSTVVRRQNSACWPVAVHDPVAELVPDREPPPRRPLPRLVGVDPDLAAGGQQQARQRLAVGEHAAPRAPRACPRRRARAARTRCPRCPRPARAAAPRPTRTRAAWPARPRRVPRRLSLGGRS